MTMQENNVLKYEEKAAFELRSLYQRYGFSQFKMSKFEEYDLYVRNKDFLISDSVITFTDTSGKLMALKPDVTLSILKNGKDEAGCVQKVYYNENVYRISEGTHTYKEIMQVGLECIGDIDRYSITEVLMLAAKSLKVISQASVLDVSHLGILSAVLDYAGAPAAYSSKMLKCIGEKNAHELSSLCKEAGMTDDGLTLLCELISLSGRPEAVLPKLVALLSGKIEDSLLSEFAAVLSDLASSEVGDVIRIDFSVVHDMRYYGGIVFKGFIDGIPTGVLSGGRYDKLLEKMGRIAGAIGFAVYLDLLEGLYSSDEIYDADVLLLYPEDFDLGALRAAVEKIAGAGERVIAQKRIPNGIKVKRVLTLSECEAKK